jgi:hypothetical protein
MTDRKLLEQALEAIMVSGGISDKSFEAVKALRERLAQPEQEPVADEEKLIDLLEAARETFKKSPSGSECSHNAAYLHYVLETMLIKREWQGLTEKEMKNLADTHLVYQVETPDVSGVFDLIRAVSEKLKEKNARND